MITDGCFHPQASLWWRSPSAWQVQSTHTISGGRRSFVDKDIIDDVDMLVVVIDIHIIFNGIVDIDIHVDISLLIYHNWLPRDPLSGHHFLLWRTDNMWSSDPEDRAIVYIRLRKLSRLSFVHILHRRRKKLKYANCLTIRRLADDGLDFAQVVNTLKMPQILTKKKHL